MRRRWVILLTKSRNYQLMQVTAVGSGTLHTAMGEGGILFEVNAP